MKRKTLLIGFGIILAWTAWPIISIFTASTIAQHFGCPLDEGSVNSCVAFGRDVGGLLYTLFGMGWFLIITIPTGLIALVAFGLRTVLFYFVKRD